MKFIAHEFPRQSFTKSLYQRLCNTFGHIAHHNLDGFYAVFFERDTDKVVFLEQTLSWPHFGDPTFTFSDVEHAVKRRLRAAKVIDIFRLLEADATRRRELATLARLQEKYGVRTPATRSGAHWLAAVFAPPAAGRSACGVIPAGQTDKAHAIGHEVGRQAIFSSCPSKFLSEAYSSPLMIALLRQSRCISSV